MPLDAAKAIAKAEAIAAAFAAIGTAEPTHQPRSRRNNEPVAWEFYVASHLSRMADARKRQAHAEAVKAGVIFDHQKTPMPPGTDRTIYAGDVVEISLVVSEPSKSFDAVGFMAALEKAGVKRQLLTSLAQQYTSDNKPPHKFSSGLLGS